MKKYNLLGALLLLSFFNAVACRFTVREIGFSILSQDIYTVAVIDAAANPNDSFWQQFHTRNRDCNLRLEILNPETDLQHPVVVNAKMQGVKFPAIILVAPDNRIYRFEENDISKIYSLILDSPLNEKMRTLFPDIFAAVLFVNGNNFEKREKAGLQIRKDCDALENIMPGMPKMVKQGPVLFPVDKDNFDAEKLLLWSLGIDSVPAEPVAFVLYGRGRIMGEALTYQQILEGGLYNYMAMIGADCECGLDRKWMLGHQIPMLWNRALRQHLAELVAFDVDNPLILAEMSRILAKETLSDASGSVAFAPETIDLDKVFGTAANEETPQNETHSEMSAGKILVYTLLGLLLIISVFGVVLYFRKKKN